MRIRYLRLLMSCGIGVLFLTALYLLMAAWPCGLPAVQAQGTIRYVATTGADTGDCTDGGAPCASVQYAVDQAHEGDEVRVAAGIYAGVQARGGFTQTIYISKTLTVRGGYSPDFAAWDPSAYTTTLDAEGHGRVFFISALTKIITPTLEALRITGGNADGLTGGPAGEDAGGGAFLWNAVAVISGCQIVDNVADVGGGIFAGGGQLLLQTSTLEDNAAADGGAVYLYVVFAVLSGNSLSDNRASSEGGAIYANNKNYPDHFLWLLVSSVVSNSAGYRGGALYMDSGQLWLEGNFIQGNTASSDGGGAYLTNVTGYLTANAIRDGRANRHGGGLYLEYGVFTLNRNLVISNTASSRGGGMYSFATTASSANTVIADNQSGSSGSGLYAQAASWQLFHSTFARNRGPSGVYAASYTIGSMTWYANLAIANAIVVSHTKGVEVTAGNAVALSGVLWYSNTVNTAGAVTVTHAITGDPAFGADGYHITTGSAALDVALASTVAEDMDLDFRPQGYGPDLGADELAGVGLAIEKRASATLVNPGQTVSYTIAITSHGIATAAAVAAVESEPAERFRDQIRRDPALAAFFGDFLRAWLPAATPRSPAATAVVLTDTLPSLQQALAIQSDRGACTLVAGWGGGARCDLGDMAPGVSGRITLTAEVTATAPATLPVVMRNLAQVAAAGASNWAYADIYLHNCHARLNDDSFEYTSVQAAVDASVAPTDVVKVSGICWGASERGGVRQQVYVSRTLTLQGGWDATFTARDPGLYPTTLNAGGQGRVLYIDRAAPFIEGLRLTGGQDWSVGGGGANLLYAAAVISDCQVTGNEGLRGGGIRADSSPATVWGSVIASNVARDPNPYDTTAGGWGGGLYLEDSDAILGANTVADNQATAVGGGAHLYLSDATLVDNEITGNSAPEAGGLYAYRHRASMVGNLFRSNTSAAGATLHLEGGDSVLSSNVITSNNSGGLLCETGNVVLEDNLVANNTGVGAHIKENGASLSRNRILDNGSFGLHLESSVGALENNVVGNNANHGVVVQGSSARLVHNTIVRNGGAGVGVWSSGALIATMTDTILAGNTVGVSVDASSAAALEATLWGSGPWANGTDWSGSAIVTGAVNLWADPAFLDPAARDYHINLTSAAVDAGVNASVAADLDAEFRPMRFGFDIGADEAAGAGLALVKESSHALIGLGGNITYTLAVASSGTAAATQVHLTDTLPSEQQADGFATDRGTCALAAGWGGGLTCDLGDMPVGATAHVTLTAQVTTTAPAGGAPWMRNQAEVRANEAANIAHADVRLQTCVARVNGALPEYDDVQAAVDAAAAGDTVAISGACLGTHLVAGTRQTVRLDREISLRGGFNQDFSIWDPASHPTTLDAQGEGRVVYIAGEISPTLRSLRVTGGNATALGGGPSGDAGGGVYVVTATVTVSDCMVYGNTASAANYGYGGGLYLASSNAILSNNTVVSNTASTTRYGYGGGLYLSGSAAALHDNTVEGNIASRADQGYGGGVYLSSSPATLSRNKVISNTARLGSASSGSGGGLYLTGSNATLTANQVMSNTAGYGGGGYLSGSNGAILDGNAILSNTTSYRGGGLYLSSSAATVQSNTVSGNAVSDRGGGLYLYESNAVVSGNVISGNLASGRGGGAYLYGGAAVVSDNRFHGNTSALGGGAYLDQSNAALTQNLFRGGSASSGAGVYLYYGGTLDRNTIEEGRATYGGGIYASSGAPIVRDNTVVDNSATQRGGGVYLNQSSAMVSGNTVHRNSVTSSNGRGGGFYLYSSVATLQANDVQDNTACTVGGGSGGGMYLEGSSATLDGNLLKNNVAGAASAGYGGGLYVTGGAPTLSANTIVSNTATLDPGGAGRGGGVYATVAGPLNLVNNIIAGNHATAEGSGVWFGGSSSSRKSAALIHTSIADNGSSGQGVYVNPYGTLSFTNTIVSGHAIAGIFVEAGGAATLEGTLWYGNGADTGGPGTIVTGAVNVYGDPAFADPLAHDYHLTGGSAALDQGIATGVSDDVDGQARPQGAAADLGADEYYPPAAPTLSISVSGADVLLTWTHDPAFASYQVWYSTDPYFAPVTDCGNPPVGMACVAVSAPTSSHTHTGAAADVAHNYAYLLLGVDAAGQRSSPSNRVGEFGFRLTPGTP